MTPKINSILHKNLKAHSLRMKGKNDSKSRIKKLPVGMKKRRRSTNHYREYRATMEEEILRNPSSGIT